MLVAHSRPQAAPLAAADQWFHLREVENGIWLIAEPPHVNSWLVLGDDRAAIVDTGLGIASMRAAVASITALPLVVVNTHAHFDHVGSNHEFSDILIHPAGAPELERPTPLDVLAGYVDYAADLEFALPQYIAADRRFFFGFAEAGHPRPFPPAARASWSIPPSRATGTFVDGDRVDLGGRVLTVLETPGHSPDHVALCLEREGILFAGDALSTGAIYAQWPESDLPTFARSAERLAGLADSLRTVYVHHFQRYAASPSLLRAAADAFAAVVAGDAVYRTNRDCAGDTVREAVFPDLSIFVGKEDPHA